MPILSCISLCLLAAPDVSPLVKDVSVIAAPGAPGSVIALTDHAAPVVMGKVDKKLLAPVVVAAEWGKGRVVAFGHSGYLDEGALAVRDTRAFLERCIRFAGHEADSVLNVGVVDGAVDAQAMQGVRFVRLGDDFSAHLKEIGVLVLGGRDLSEKQQVAIGAWVQGGGGLVVAQTGWGWQQIKGGADMRTNTLNHLLRPAGIAWTDETVERTNKEGFDVAKRPQEPENAAAAIKLLIRTEQGDASRLVPDGAGGVVGPQELVKTAAALATRAVRLLPADDATIRPQLRELLALHAAELVPTEKKPLDDKHPLLRFLLAMQIDELRGVAAGDVKAHPAAAEFPGSVPADAPRVTRTVQVDTAVPQWHSVGLYAAPGAELKVTQKSAATGSVKPGKELAIRIGAHTDQLWHLPAWKRVPEISMRRTLPSGGTLSLASPFGGVVYVEVPEGLAGGVVDVEISGAVESPLFVLGKTSVNEWKKTNRHAPGAWAEFACDSVIVTVPSAAVREIEDPTEICTIWQQVLDNAADLAAMPHARKSPQRYVADEQISAGYMHSGYPIMTHLDAVPDMTQAAKLKAGSWGLFHELGHNHQQGDWTFEGTGEVTNNLWSLYLMETIAGKKPGQGHGATDEWAKRRERAKVYLDAGADFNKWKSDPFLALEMYLLMREEFGWEPFKKVFAEYRGLKKGEHPKDDAAKRDEWMVRMSRAVGRNLGPYFMKWGVPTSEAARHSIKNLPEWMPEAMK